MRDPTSVVWRRCFAAGTEVVLTILVLVATIFVAGDVRSLKHGCPNPVPGGHACFHYRSSTYLMRESVFAWFALTLTVLVVVVVKLTVATRLRVAVDTLASAPRFHTPVTGS